MADEVLNENIVEEENKLPDLIIEVPEVAEGIDLSEWCSNTKRILGKKYNVIFVDPREANN